MPSGGNAGSLFYGENKKEKKKTMNISLKSFSNFFLKEPTILTRHWCEYKCGKGTKRVPFRFFFFLPLLVKYE